MSKKSERKEKMPPEDLLIGLFVDLELSWTEHPFTFARFKISSEKQLSAIKALGLAEITVIPDRSDVGIPEHSNSTESDESKSAINELWEDKNAQIVKAQFFRDKRQDVSKRYLEQAKKVQRITKEMKSQPANAIHNVDEVVDDLTSAFDGEGDLMTNLVNLGSGKHTDYNHAVNVTMLSLMLGKAIELPKEKLQQLGMGALLHDLGKIDVPSAITMKKAKLTQAEAKILARHTISGCKLVERVRQLPRDILDIIELHHEFLDGTGYPHGIPATKLSALVRIVAVVNTYDNLCNPANPNDALTPKTALAMMYSKYKDKLDRQLVESFIRVLGVYPPGTIVRLSDDSIGLVITANPKTMLQPEVLLYNPDIPKEQAIIINLIDFDDLSIKEVLRPSEYPSQIFTYLGIEERLGYFIDFSPS